MRDYAKERSRNGTVHFDDGTVLHVLTETSTWVRAIIREACAEAIRDTQRRERKRAARIVKAFKDISTADANDISARILGTRRKK